VEDPADQAQLAMRVLGESGSDMLKVMRGGPGPIRDLMQEADSLGLTLDTKTGKAAERAMDGLTNLTAGTRATQIAFARYLGPTVADITEGIGNAMPKAIFYSGKAFTGLKATVVGFAAWAIKHFAKVYDLLALLPGHLGETYETAAASARTFAADLKDLSKAYEGEYENMEFTLADFNAAVGDGADITAVYDETLKNLAARQKEEAAAAKLGAAAAKEAAAERTKAEKAAASAREAIERRIAGIYEATRTPLETYTEQVRELIALRGQGLDDDTFTRAIVQAQEQLEGLAEKAGETSDDLSEFGKQGARNMQTAFADFLFNPFEKGLGGMLDGFTSILQRMAAEAAAAAIFDKFGGAEGLGAVLGGLFGAITPRAIGGPMAAGMPYWAGEHGRELIVPASASRAVPGGRGAGLVTVNNNVTISAPGGRVDRRSIQQLQAGIGEATSRALARNR
jgi:hypothetical protein